VSLLIILEDGSSVEVATVGREGVVSMAIHLEGERALVTGIVQLPGTAVRIEAHQLAVRSSNDRSEDLLRRSTRALLWQITRSAGCIDFTPLSNGARAGFSRRTTGHSKTTFP
jgi:hypothetical protein